MTTSISLQIPSAFIAHHIGASWSALFYGLEKQLVSPRTLVEIAREMKDSADLRVFELAGLGSDDLWRVRELVTELAQPEAPVQQAELRDAWVYVILKWVFEHKGLFADPLGIVEEIFAQFDYPPQIRQFVRFLPDDGYDSTRHTNEENTSRLYGLWEDFIRQNGPKVGRK